MKKTFFLIVCLICTSCMAQSYNEMPCWVADDYSAVITKQEAILTSYLYPINLTRPIEDAELRIEFGDYRLIGIGGFGISYPGIDMRIDGEVLCSVGRRYLQGTSDAQESHAHAELIQNFKIYAEVYNKKILGFYKANIQGK